MANNPFEALGGLMKGLSSFMPQDDPDVKVMNAASDVSDLEKQEAELYADVGKKALSKQNSEIEYAVELAQLASIRAKILQAQETLKQAEEAKKEKIGAKRSAAIATCPNCDYVNPEGIKFCQECGTKLGQSRPICAKCGAAAEPGIKFCGECGARL